MPIPQQFKNKLALPAIAAPMFLASGPELVIETCKAGVIGSFPSLNQRDTAGFEEWLIKIKATLATYEKETGKAAAPFAVNLIVMPNPRLEEDLAICIKHKVPLIITSLGVQPKVVEAIHSYGGLVFHDVVKGQHARKAASIGVDGLIAVSAGAGGHSGSINPLALVAEIRKFFDKTLVLGGSVSHGQDIAAAQALGADMAYMGTRFIATKEAMVQNAYKEMLVSSTADQIAYTNKISGMMANFLIPSMEQAGLDKQGNTQADVPRDSSKTGWRDIWSAGHGVSAIDDVPAVRDLVLRLKQEYQNAINSLREKSREFV